MKILAFFHTWVSNKRLQSPYNTLVKSLENLGADVHIIWSNELLQNSNLNNLCTFADDFSEDRLIQYIKNAAPDLVLSINNGGMSKRVRASITCPVVKWLFDDIPHLFFHDGPGPQSLESAFVSDDLVACYASNLMEQMLKRYPHLKGRVHLVPHAIDFKSFDGIPVQEKHKISFVGSILDFGPVVRYLATYHFRDPAIARRILAAVERLRADYNHDFDKTIEELELEVVLEEHKINRLELKRALSDLISTQVRMITADSISDLGLAIFGVYNWLDGILFSPGIGRAFQYGQFIKTPEALAEVYQSSKISIDILNVQNVNALSNRVFDIMASQALLITKYQKDSDAFKLFGPDCPIPMYRDLNHLKELCQYYLDNEDKRLELVKKCNQLVSTGSSYDDRTRQILKLAGQSIAANPKPGTVSFVNTALFQRPWHTGRFKRNLKARARSVLLRKKSVNPFNP